MGTITPLGCDAVLSGILQKRVHASDFNCDFSTFSEIDSSVYNIKYGIENLTEFCSFSLEKSDGEGGSLTTIRKICAWLGSVLILINIGTKTSFKECKSNFKRPVGIVIGFLSQFTIMPILAMLIIYFFKNKLTKFQALGIFCCGCAPGGTLSNFVVGSVNGDINLSVAMTITSQVASIVMIPLWLKVYETFSRAIFLNLNLFDGGDPAKGEETWEMESSMIDSTSLSSHTSSTVQTVPISSVLQALFSCLCSLWLGYYSIRRNNFKPIMLKIRGPLAAVGFLLTIVAMALVFLTEKGIINKGWKLFATVAPITIIMPVSGIFLGYILGYLAYKLVYLEYKRLGVIMQGSQANNNDINKALDPAKPFNNINIKSLQDKNKITWTSPCLRTIAIETGIQNIVIPSLLFNLNFQCPAVLVELISITVCFLLSQYITIVTIILIGKIFFKETKEVAPLLIVPETSDSELRSEENSEKLAL